MAQTGVACTKLLAHICVVCEHLGDDCRARFAESEDAATRNEYRLTVSLLQFHEIVMRHPTTGTRQQAACSFEQSVTVDNDCSVRVHAVDVVSTTYINLRLRFRFWGRRWRRLKLHTDDILGANTTPHLPPPGRRVERKQDIRIAVERPAESAGGG
jgi:hypothetical protein